MKIMHHLVLPLLLPVTVIGGMALFLLDQANAQRGAAQAAAQGRMALARELSGIGAELAVLQQQVGEAWAADARGRREAAFLEPVRADVAQRLTLLGQRVAALTSSPVLLPQGGDALRGAFDGYRHEVLVYTGLAGGEPGLAARHMALARAHFTAFYQHERSLVHGLGQQAEADDLRDQASAAAAPRWMAGSIALGLALPLLPGWLAARIKARRAPAARAGPVEPPGVPRRLNEETPRAPQAPERIEPDEQAFYDPLTNLPNRWLVLERLRQAIRTSTRRGSGLAVLFLDLDNFAQFNELHGASKGDLMLKEVAARLLHTVRSSDTVGRLGGDEFLVLVEDLPDEPADAAALASMVADKLRAALGAPYQLGELCCEASASVGVSLNMDGSPEEIIQTAGAALLAIKRAKTFD